MNQTRPHFVDLSFFSQYNDMVKNSLYKSIVGVLGIRPRNRRMVGADEYAELCQRSWVLKHKNSLYFESKLNDYKQWKR